MENPEKNPSEPNYPTLRAWLRQATTRLVDEARERVRLEVTAHFEDARRAYLDAGFSTEEAESQALDALGPAPKARRQFEHVYLTKGEQGQIDAAFKFTTVAMLSIARCFMYLMVYHLVMAWWHGRSNVIYLEFPGFLSVFLFECYSFRLNRQLKTGAVPELFRGYSMRQMWFSFNLSYLICVNLWMNPFSSKWAGPIFLILEIVILVPWFYSARRLYRKLKSGPGGVNAS